MPPPVPPRVYAGRTSTGYFPISLAASFASSTERTVLLCGIGSPMRSIISLNSSLSSERAMASGWVPSSLMPKRSSVPFSASSEQMLRAVCPPIPERMPSTFSFSAMRATVSTVRGSTYTMSAVSTSVCMVAGLEFTSTVW